MNRLDGKVAFLSGAARGIGGATAKLMASAGAKVAIGDVLDERGRQTVKEIESAGGAGAASGGGPAKLMASAGAKVAIGDVLDERGRQTVKEIESAGGQALYVSLDVTQKASWAAARGA